MSDTPRTDAFFKEHSINELDGNGNYVALDLLRQLERELAAAIRDNENLTSDWKQADTDTIRALHERNEAREQRDRLAEALREMVFFHDSGCGGDGTVEKANKALDAMKGWGDE